MSYYPKKLVMIDCEMTGVQPKNHKLLQVAALKLKLNEEAKQYEVVGDDPFVQYMSCDEVPRNDFQKKYLSHVFEACNKTTEHKKEMKSNLEIEQEK